MRREKKDRKEGVERGTCPAVPLLTFPITDMPVVPTVPQGKIRRRGSQVSENGLLQMLPSFGRCTNIHGGLQSTSCHRE